ncbi:MAG: NAD-dependent malic enzyme [Peptococcaceae bacterium]|nr:NAD-dependent malic enzyme [Peptococcaceae bacterium]
MFSRDEAIALHRKLKGKISISPKIPITTYEELSLAYTPGVAVPCQEIHHNKDLVYQYTAKQNLVAIVSNGTAVLGLGNIGPEAALPVMEGKSMLFKAFAGIDAIPLCIKATSVEEVVQFVTQIAPTFGGINLEDIAAPECFKIEQELKRRLDIPVFHDDQHGTAVVVVAGLLNAFKLTNRKPAAAKVVINGAGSAGIAIAHLLLKLGIKHIIVCDSKGILYPGRNFGTNPYKEEISRLTNPDRIQGGLADALVDADVFIGVSKADILTPDMIKKMQQNPIIFALANPDPEIHPQLALEAGAAVVATGRSDYPNQVNNVLAFPGIFKGALTVRATDINASMKLAAAQAIANLAAKELRKDYIIPKPLDGRVVEAVAKATAAAAIETGAARVLTVKK